jgi:hypothetical protein
MRVGCSALKNDLFTYLKVVPSPMCACGRGIENAIHFFFDCELYARQRVKMEDELYKIARFSAATLLYGDKDLSDDVNATIFKTVHIFIEETERLL